METLWVEASFFESCDQTVVVKSSWEKGLQTILSVYVLYFCWFELAISEFIIFVKLGMYEFSIFWASVVRNVYE